MNNARRQHRHLHSSDRVDLMVQACAHVGLEFLSLAPRSAAWAWGAGQYWRVHTRPDATNQSTVTAQPVDQLGNDRGGDSRDAAGFTRASRRTIVDALNTPAVAAPDWECAAEGSGREEPHKEGQPASSQDTAADSSAVPVDPCAAAEAVLLARARVWQFTMLRDKRFNRTIVGADIARILGQTDSAPALIELFNEYTDHVPSDIAREVQSVLDWVPWESRPPVYATRSDIPDNLYTEVSAMADRKRAMS